MGHRHHTQTAPPVLPPPPARTEEARGGSAEPARARRRFASLALVGVVGVALGTGIGIAVSRGSSAAIAGADEPIVLASQRLETDLDTQGIARAERVVAAVLAAAPECEPEIRMAGAPADEREEFLREAEDLAAQAEAQQGLRNVVWRVVERDGRLFGVLYGERCD